MSGGRHLAPRALTAGGVAVALLMAACGGGSSPGTGGTVPPTATRSYTPTPSTAVPGVTSTAAVTASFDPDSRPGVLVAAGGYTSTGLDHVSLSFRRGPPPCVARYLDPPIAGPAGRVVPVVGSAFVRIRCRQVTGVHLQPVGPDRDLGHLRPGTDRFRIPGAKNVAEVVLAGYRSSVLTVVVGLRHVAPMTGGMFEAGWRHHLEFDFGQ